jgi:hypothetical protein
MCGSGIAMTTRCRSKGAELSYSMLTYDSAPDADGHALMVRGTRASSRLW